MHVFTVAPWRMWTLNQWLCAVWGTYWGVYTPIFRLRRPPDVRGTRDGSEVARITLSLYRTEIYFAQKYIAPRPLSAHLWLGMRCRWVREMPQHSERSHSRAQAVYISRLSHFNLVLSRSSTTFDRFMSSAVAASQRPPRPPTTPPATEYHAPASPRPQPPAGTP